MQTLEVRQLLALLLAMLAPVAGAVNQEVHRTWYYAELYLPGEHLNGEAQFVSTIAAVTRSGALERIPADTEYPTVLYLHGCDGIHPESEHALNFLTDAGYAVVQPNSFARRQKPKSCLPERKIGGLHRGVLAMRHAEADYALRVLRNLPWVDQARVYLMGISEGGIATATYEGRPVTARVIEGWTCHAGWPEYNGLNAPPNEPVLALVGAEDPWFQVQPGYKEKPAGDGHCGEFMRYDNGSRSIVYEAPALRDRHWLSGHEAVQERILTFLARHPNTD